MLNRTTDFGHTPLEDTAVEDMTADRPQHTVTSVLPAMFVQLAGVANEKEFLAENISLLDWHNTKQCA